MAPPPVLAPSLVRFRGAVNRKYPTRDHQSDGWIGNEAHRLVRSDHNPDSRGIVHAVDIDRDGIHVPTILVALMMSPATHYVIHNRRIFSAKDHFVPHRYTGENPHVGHIHGSIWHTGFAEEWNGNWGWVYGWVDPHQAARGSKGGQTRIIQAYSNAYGYSLEIDGDFGPATERAVRKFQARMGIKVDGIVGPQTRGKYLTGKP